MIEFNHLIEGLFYYHNCLLCNGSMSIQNEGLANNSIYADNRLGYNLVFNLEKIDKLIINPYTEDIEIESYKYNDPGADYFNSSINKNYSSHYDYIDSFQININCSKCRNFSYKLDLIIDLLEKKIYRKLLSEETICLEENSGSYFIINDFNEEITSLLFSGVNSAKTVLSSSLIEIDYNNPQNTLNRLKKLIIFS